MVKLLVLVDAVVVVVALVVWLVLHRGGDERANAVNDGLRGSTPPAGRVLLDLTEIDGIAPAPPAPASLRGEPVVLIGTCFDCRSGQLVGGLLGRMPAGDLPRDTRVVLVGWDGDPRAWAREWHVGADGSVPVDVFSVTGPAGVAQARALFGIGPRDGQEESAITFLYDPRGRQRSTYFVGQLNREDLEHDLRVLARD